MVYLFRYQNRHRWRTLDIGYFYLIGLPTILRYLFNGLQTDIRKTCFAWYSCGIYRYFIELLNKDMKPGYFISKQQKVMSITRMSGVNERRGGGDKIGKIICPQTNLKRLFIDSATISSLKERERGKKVVCLLKMLVEFARGVQKIEITTILASSGVEFS